MGAASLLACHRYQQHYRPTNRPAQLAVSGVPPPGAPTSQAAAAAAAAVPAQAHVGPHSLQEPQRPAVGARVQEQWTPAKPAEGAFEVPGDAVTGADAGWEEEEEEEAWRQKRQRQEQEGGGCQAAAQEHGQPHLPPPTVTGASAQEAAQELRHGHAVEGSHFEVEHRGLGPSLAADAPATGPARHALPQGQQQQQGEVDDATVEGPQAQQQIPQQQQRQQRRVQGKHSPAGAADSAAPSAKLPLRTLEGQTALERIRQLQARRRQLYGRLEQRQHEQRSEQGWQRAEEQQQGQVSAGPQQQQQQQPPPSQQQWRQQAVEEGEATGHVQQRQHWEQPELSDGQPAAEPGQHQQLAAAQTGREGWLQEEVVEHLRQQEEAASAAAAAELARLPAGMGFDALRQRSLAASRAAVGATAAARQGADALAVAAEAAERAALLAQQAQHASAAAHLALDLRAAEAVEQAAAAAQAAEVAAEAAAQQAAVAAARAVVAKHEAGQQAKVAGAAADLRCAAA